MLAQEEAKGR
jgi:predicted transcriptional regulator